MPSWNQFTEEHLIKVTWRIRKRRVAWFVRCLNLGPTSSVLDLGSEGGSCLGSCYPYPQNIWLADVPSAEPAMQAGVKAYGLRGYYVLPPDGPLPFSNRQFDAVWCNSVIEHVTVDRAKCASIPNTEFIRPAELHQAAFAKEISRVGKSYFVQTPYKHFPVEAHAWLPFVQYLPLPVRHRFSRITRAIWIKQ